MRSRINFAAMVFVSAVIIMTVATANSSTAAADVRSSPEYISGDAVPLPEAKTVDCAQSRSGCTQREPDSKRRGLGYWVFYGIWVVIRWVALWIWGFWQWVLAVVGGAVVLFVMPRIARNVSSSSRRSRRRACRRQARDTGSDALKSWEEIARGWPENTVSEIQAPDMESSRAELHRRRPIDADTDDDKPRDQTAWEWLEEEITGQPADNQPLQIDGDVQSQPETASLGAAEQEGPLAAPVQDRSRHEPAFNRQPEDTETDRERRREGLRHQLQQSASPPPANGAGRVSEAQPSPPAASMPSMTRSTPTSTDTHTASDSAGSAAHQSSREAAQRIREQERNERASSDDPPAEPPCTPQPPSRADDGKPRSGRKTKLIAVIVAALIVVVVTVIVVAVGIAFSFYQQFDPSGITNNETDDSGTTITTADIEATIAVIVAAALSPPVAESPTGIFQAPTSTTAAVLPPPVAESPTGTFQAPTSTAAASLSEDPTLLIWAVGGNYEIKVQVEDGSRVVAMSQPLDDPPLALNGSCQQHTNSPVLTNGDILRVTPCRAGRANITLIDPITRIVIKKYDPIDIKP